MTYYSSVRLYYKIVNDDEKMLLPNCLLAISDNNAGS